MYKPIQIDRENLTIMGVAFPDLETLNRTANAIGSNMFEGFEPTMNNSSGFIWITGLEKLQMNNCSIILKKYCKDGLFLSNDL